MYWNNTWVNNFNSKNFFNKTMFLTDIFVFIFSEKIFKLFFFNEDQIKNDTIYQNKEFFLKKVLLRREKKSTFLKMGKNNMKKKKLKLNKYNFSKLWLIKYNNYILLTTFVFFYFKIKPKRNSFKKILPIVKTPKIFWKKRKGQNLKRKIFLLKEYTFF